MTLFEIQNSPYDFKRIPLKLGINETESECFSGKIDKLEMLKIGVAGIFISVPNGKEVAKSTITYLKTFYYEVPKRDYKKEDCPEASHVIILSDFEVTKAAYESFVRSLYSSEINKMMKEPISNPFKNLHTYP